MVKCDESLSTLCPQKMKTLTLYFHYSLKKSPNPIITFHHFTRTPARFTFVRPLWRQLRGADRWAPDSVANHATRSLFSPPLLPVSSSYFSQADFRIVTLEQERHCWNITVES